MTYEDRIILSKTVFGEARGEDDEGRRAVAHVIMNRVTWAQATKGRDHTVAAACLRWKQFSCWGYDDPNRALLLSLDDGNPAYRLCMASARAAELELDFTKGARWYHAVGIKPSWAAGKTPCYSHGRHVFYNDIE